MPKKLNTKSKSKFGSDRRFGEKAEFVLIEKFESCGLPCTKSDSGESGWDVSVEVDAKQLLLEVKLDAKSAITGNIAIEFHNPKSNKPSGIEVTKAHLWCFAFRAGEVYELYIAPVNLLKCYMRDVKPVKIIDVGGDDNASLYLYRKDIILRDIFCRVDNVERDELVSSLKFYLEVL